MKLVVATRNSGKLAELQALLAGLPFELCDLSLYPHIGEIEETGHTFAENAALKAETTARLTGEWSLADDSGLEVDALDGRPGVYSARFAGPAASDTDNNEKLLHLLQNVPHHLRTARFRAVIAVAHPHAPTSFAEGSCEGVILSAPRGNGGFGYDPLFLYPPAGQTFAELPAAEKNCISHRAKALAAAQDILQLIASGSQT